MTAARPLAAAHTAPGRADLSVAGGRGRRAARGAAGEPAVRAAWAVATRTPGNTEAQFARLFDDGVIVRTHVLRPTWHLVSPDDIRWLVEPTAPRVSRVMRQLQRDLHLDDAVLDASGSAVWCRWRR